MASLPVPRILRYGSPELREICRPVAPDETDLPALVEALAQAVAEQGGVGLSAPQIGDRRRVVVIVDPRRPGRRELLVLVNPVMSVSPDRLAAREEGCLSFPGLYLRLRRARAVRVTHLDLEGRERWFEAEGLLARIVQHEIDHLDGVLFIDHLSPWARRLLWWRLRRLRGR